MHILDGPILNPGPEVHIEIFAVPIFLYLYLHSLFLVQRGGEGDLTDILFISHV
jgi:hypothetical protein